MEHYPADFTVLWFLWLSLAAFVVGFFVTVGHRLAVRLFTRKP